MTLSMIAVVAAVSASFAAAQSPNVAPTQRLLPKVAIELEPGFHSEQVDIRYYMTGEFGGYSSFVRQQPNMREYVIGASFENKPAREITVLAYAPGCEFASFDIALTANVEVEKRQFRCQPLRDVPITGYIDPHELPTEKPVDVVAELEATWICRYFNMVDCLVPSVSLGKVGSIDPARGGEFQMTVPDFLSDPTINSVDQTTGTEAGTILFVLKDRLLGRTLAAIKPKDSAQGQRGLSLQRDYPSPVVFTIVH